LKLAKEYEVEITRFADRKSGRPVYKIGPIEFDQTKCIDCRNCLEICQKQSGGFLELTGRGYEIGITPSADTQKDCLYCGQCIVHCPVGAIEAEGEFEEIEKPLLDAAKTVVVQFAPSIRSSIGEMFDLPPGAIMEGQLVAGLKQLGFKKVLIQLSARILLRLKKPTSWWNDSKTTEFCQCLLPAVLLGCAMLNFFGRILFLI